MDVSHVSLSMKPSGGLFVYKNRGLPTTEKVVLLNCPRKMKKELKRMKKEMSLKDETEILLAISVASDDMIRSVHMFPEVFYMDVTANTNKQKRNLFLMVVKDVNGETFIGNATIIPSGKRWVFQEIYTTFFIHLCGEETIGCNRLALTDDDSSEHGPLDNVIRTMFCYASSKHMLCVFHAIVMAYFEQVHPKLPHKRTKKKELTDDGEIYGKSKSYSVIPISLYPILRSHVVLS